MGNCHTEGNYTKVLDAKMNFPAPEFEFFVNRILDTIRFEIASSSEQAYTSLSTSSACKLLMLNSEQELNGFLQQFTSSQEDPQFIWKISGNELSFKPKVQAKTNEIPHYELMTQALNYAIELERIV